MSTESNENLSSAQGLKSNLWRGRVSLFLWSMHGLPYRWGGNNPLEGMDCSGLVMYLLKWAGVMEDIDLSAQGIFDWATKRDEQIKEHPQGLGSILFFGKNTDSITHIAVQIDDEFMMEAVGDSSVQNVDNAKFWGSGRGAFIRPSPLTRRTDFLCSWLPDYFQ